VNACHSKITVGKEMLKGPSLTHSILMLSLRRLYLYFLDLICSVLSIKEIKYTSHKVCIVVNQNVSRGTESPSVVASISLNSRVLGPGFAILTCRIMQPLATI
jgi:hypothetical protein